MKLIKHTDGIWMTSEYHYKNRKILIKSRKDYGIKAHIFLPNSDKVDFTRRYGFIDPDTLLEVCKEKIDLKNTQTTI